MHGEMSRCVPVSFRQAFDVPGDCVTISVQAFQTELRTTDHSMVDRVSYTVVEFLLGNKFAVWQTVVLVSSFEVYKPGLATPGLVERYSSVLITWSWRRRKTPPPEICAAGRGFWIPPKSSGPFVV